jgi:hypothetical protein
MKHKTRKTYSAPHAFMRNALPPVLKTRKKGKRKCSALHMKLRFAVSEKHFLIT